ncbi:MAG: Uncharacterised protein [Prochlorococcus marinus str. MIT 9215]|nr:MAG: Uncharacterised protein [Prochlorococcus marinus str. MIT 9215]
MGNASHRHTPDGFASFFASQGELEQARELNGIFKKTFKKVPESVEENPFWVLAF